MTEIPADVMAAAVEVGNTALRNLDQDDVSFEISIIARAIMAERERCLGECDHFLNDIEIEIGRKKRFDIYDIQRQARKSVRYVRDRISGEFDEKWTTEEAEDVPPK